MDAKLVAYSAASNFCLLIVRRKRGTPENCHNSSFPRMAGQPSSEHRTWAGNGEGHGKCVASFRPSSQEVEA